MHTHADGVEHEHPHSHEHGHEEEHDHTHTDHCGSCNGCDGKDQTAALLSYMYQHNQSHAAELDQMAGKLQAEGREKAAEQIRKAVDEFQKGNMYLNLALAMVNEGQ
jgi:ABC-type Zn2+ transport system substrate-binding protein/surface adhesin